MRMPTKTLPRPPRRVLPLLAGALLVVTATPARAETFGPDLATATPNYGVGCGLVGGWQGCTVEEPLQDDMELVLPDPVAYGDQTGVVTAIHVKAAASAPAQFVVVEWSGRPDEGHPFPSGVMAVSAPVTLQPGINHFSTNLPVDRRLADNGFESWSVVALNVLDGTSPIPAQSGGSLATTGVLLDNGRPLTQTAADLTLVPHNVVVGGLPPATLLMAGDVTITTGQDGDDTTDTDTDDEDGDDTETAAPELTVSGTPRVRGRRATLRLKCAGAAACNGTVRLQSRAAGAKRKARTYASGAFAIPAGGSGAVRAKLSSAGRKAVRHHRTLRAYANATFAGGAVTSARVTLKR